VHYFQNGSPSIPTIGKGPKNMLPIKLLKLKCFQFLEHVEFIKNSASEHIMRNIYVLD
jgi:hypothetical protein